MWSVRKRVPVHFLSNRCELKMNNCGGEADGAQLKLINQLIETCCLLIRWRQQFKHAGGLVTNTESIGIISIVILRVARRKRRRRRSQYGTRWSGSRRRGRRRSRRRSWRWRRRRSAGIFALFRFRTDFITLSPRRLGRSCRIEFRRACTSSGSFIQQHSSRVIVTNFLSSITVSRIPSISCLKSSNILANIRSKKIYFKPTQKNQPLLD